MGANCGFGRKPAYAYVLYHATAQSDRKKGTRKAIYTHTSIRKHHASLSSSVMSPQTKNVCNSTALTIDAEATAQPTYSNIMARSPERCSFTTPRAQLPQHSWHNCHISRGNMESRAESQVQPTIWSGASENTVARSQIATTQLAQLPETYYGSRYWCCFQVLRAPTHPYISDKKSGKNYFPIKEIFSLSPSTPCDLARYPASGFTKSYFKLQDGHKEETISFGILTVCLRKCEEIQSQ